MTLYVLLIVSRVQKLRFRGKGSSPLERITCEYPKPALNIEQVGTSIYYTCCAECFFLLSEVTGHAKWPMKLGCVKFLGNLQWCFYRHVTHWAYPPPPPPPRRVRRGFPVARNLPPPPMFQMSNVLGIFW